MKELYVIIATLIVCLFVFSEPGYSQSSEYRSPYDNGALKLDFKYIDDLLLINSDNSLRIIIVDYSSNKEVSSAHLALLFKWINSGGILWFSGSGFNSSLFDKVNPGIDIDAAQFEKESGARFNNQIGELFVKDLLPDIVIGDHQITNGVNMLYVKPYKADDDDEWIRFFTQQNSIKITPIIYFKTSSNGISLWTTFNYDDEKIKRIRSNNIILFGIAERGNGLIIFDFTDTINKNWDGPDGNEYDGPKFFKNIINYNRH